VERAQDLLLATDEPISQIALACGLADQCHLCRLFRKLAGESPAAWRRARQTRRRTTDQSLPSILNSTLRGSPYQLPL
jgi:transcriptional regulator GlxA family with amidase domain